MALGDPPNSLLGTLATHDVSDMWKYLNTNENANLYAQLSQAAQQAVVTGVTQLPVKPPPSPPNGSTLANRARELFLKRMGGIRAEMKVADGDYLNCHVFGEMVFVFYCFAGREGCAKESIDLFPSDQFITQFRLILS